MVSRMGLTVPSGATSAAPRIGYGKSSPTVLLITFWKKILIAPPSDRDIDQGRREPVEGDHGRRPRIGFRPGRAAGRTRRRRRRGPRARWLEAPAGRSSGAAPRG